MNNDHVVLGIPNILCPSCRQNLDIHNANRIDKYTKRQRRERHGGGGSYSSVGESIRMTGKAEQDTTGEDSPSLMPEKNFIVTSCQNERCEQYNKIKVFEIPRIETPSVKVDL